MNRAEAAISHALTEVFDGPLVRQLLGRRAKVRRTELDDRAGAAADLKKLHDLSPTDASVMEDLSGLLTELGDYRGMVQLYEDQILRGKDMNARAELARKVARMWEEQLQDPREAADAWRRVLRMRAGDPEATAGLERAKTNMLKRPDPNAPADQYSPPKPTVPPPPPPESDRHTAKTTPPAPAMIPTPAASFVPPGRMDLPADTGGIVAALVDTSETPAEMPLPRAAVPPPEERGPDSEHPTMALGQEEVAALTRGLGPRSTESSESASTARQPTTGPSTLRGGAAAPSDAMSSTDERPAIALDFNDETIARPIDPDASSEIVDIDELAVDVEEEEKPRSIPPPLPRN